MTGASQPGASAFAEKQSARGRLHYLTAETVFTTHGPFRAHSPAANQRVVYVGHGEPLAKSAGYWRRTRGSVRPSQSRARR